MAEAKTAAAPPAEKKEVPPVLKPAEAPKKVEGKVESTKPGDSPKPGEASKPAESPKPKEAPKPGDPPKAVNAAQTTPKADEKQPTAAPQTAPQTPPQPAAVANDAAKTTEDVKPLPETLPQYQHRATESLDMSHTLFPVHTKNIKGSSLGKKSFRIVKYPVGWAYNRIVGAKAIDEVKIMSAHLPVFFIIPKQSEIEVLPFVKKHVVKLQDGKRIIAKKDMENCRDSRSWFNSKTSWLIEDNLIALAYNRQLIEELDSVSPTAFGRYLNAKWDSGKQRGWEEIKYQRKVRK